MKKNLLLIVLFIAIIFFGRILPHPYNFTPLIAVTLLSSYSLSNKFLAIMIPLVGFWISDLFMNNYIYAGYFADFTVFNSGMIWINTWLHRDLRVPFGGVKKSGMGREGGRWSLDFFSETMNICIKDTK